MIQSDTHDVLDNLPLPQWQMDAEGNHRIVLGSIEGEWATYCAPAILHEFGTNNVRLVAFTACFDGVFPIEKVLRLEDNVQQLNPTILNTTRGKPNL